MKKRAKTQKKVQEQTYSGKYLTSTSRALYNSSDFYRKEALELLTNRGLSKGDARKVATYRLKLVGDTAAGLEPVPETDYDKNGYRLAPKPEKEITAPNGWLSPEGKFYSCDYTQHAEIADAVCRQLGMRNMGFTSINGELELENRGWIKFQKGTFPTAEPHIFGFGHMTRQQPTEKQIRLVTDFCLINKVELPHWVEDVR